MSKEQIGRLSRWDDAKGFGFIKPEGGGADVFAHISVVRGERRPQVGDQVMYVAGRDDQGRLRAEHLRLAGELAIDLPKIRQKPRQAEAVTRKKAVSKAASEPPAIRNFGAKVLVWLALCLLPLSGSALLLRAGIPWALALYTGASLISFVQYAWDKGRAEKGGQRTPENTLHAVELLGGWPGALIAQQVFRHKTRKGSYQAVFWAIVAAHQVFWLDYLLLDGRYIAKHIPFVI